DVHDEVDVDVRTFHFHGSTNGSGPSVACLGRKLRGAGKARPSLKPPVGRRSGRRWWTWIAPGSLETPDRGWSVTAKADPKVARIVAVDPDGKRRPRGAGWQHRVHANLLAPARPGRRLLPGLLPGGLVRGDTKRYGPVGRLRESPAQRYRVRAPTMGHSTSCEKAPPRPSIRP